MGKSTISELQAELAEKRRLVEEREAALASEREAAEEYVAKKVARAQAALDEARRDADEYVSKISSALGLPDPTAARRTKLRLKRVRELLGQEKSPEEIARETGESLEVIREDVARLRKSGASEKGDAPQKKGWKRERVRKLLVEEHLTVEEVADRLDMSVVNVRAHVYQLKVAGLLSVPPSSQKESSPDRVRAATPLPPPPASPGTETLAGEVVDTLRAEVARQQGGQRAKAAVLLTAPASGHSHRALVDRMGDGTTQSDETGHVHQVRRFVVCPAADHQHVLRALPGKV